MTDERIGAGSLPGRKDGAWSPQQVRAEELEQPDGEAEDGTPIFTKPRALGRAIPSNCLRVLNSPLTAGQGGGCDASCQGRQRDGGCLCDIVRAAKAAGVRWKFDVDPHDGFWDYDGEPIPGFVTERRDFGQIHTRWEAGHEPPAPFEVVPPEPQSFECPHCGAHVDQDPENFHWWCTTCGKNATEAQ